MAARDPVPRGVRALTELVAGVLKPVTNRPGFALAELRAAWSEIVGARYADWTEPERIEWPRGPEKGNGAVLRVRAAGPRAVLLQHELGQLAERVNAFLGPNSIGRIKLVQGRVERLQSRNAPAQPAVDEARLTNAVSGVDDEALRAALARLGRGVLGSQG
jgi:hypothetical protein